MASIPPQASRRRSDQPSSFAAQQPSEGTPSNAQERSQSFLLNTPYSTTNFSGAGVTEQPQAVTKPLIPNEPRTCWICQQDDSDDTPETSEWRSPCPCSLTAHESCLLEWINAEEAPKPGDVAPQSQIVCPQCKSEIRIDRPKDYLVIATERLQRAAVGLILPTAVSAVFGCFYSGFMVYGVNTLQLVFGRDEAARLMAPNPDDIATYYAMQRGWRFKIAHHMLRLMDPFMPSTDSIPSWGLFIGLPLIGPSLILSRTKIADQVFAILPVTYFMFRPDNSDLRHWPPSPALTLAVLPYLRSAYNELYRFTVGDLEKKWDQAVQRKPREGETAEQIAEQNAEHEAEGIGRAIFDLELEFVQEDVDMPQIENDARRLRRPANVVADNEIEQNPEANQLIPDEAAQQQDQAPRRPARNQAWEIRQNVSTASLASKVMGALFLPAVSSVMGDVLKSILPTRWVTKQTSRVAIRASARGLLQEKWGRSIVGGCLFVVLKDVVILYCKWKKARDFGKKKVVDYVRKSADT